MSSVRLESVSKHFGDVVAVDAIDLEVEDRELMVLVGPSGCGKTTTLRMIAGLEQPTSGTISIGERDVTDVDAMDRNIAMVFQNYALYPHMNVFRNMAFGLQMRKVARQEIQTRVGEAAKSLGIDGLLERRPAQLSGGERQRVALGRAIVRNPEVFLLDEPLSNLDAKLRVSMRSELVSLRKGLGATMVYVTHDQVEAMTMGDRIVVMRDGRIHQVGTPRDVYLRPADRFVAEFIGNPPMNIIEGRITSDSGRPVLVAGDLSLPLVDELGQAATRLDGDRGKDRDGDRHVDVGIRPENVRLGESSEHLAGTSEATVVGSQYLGAEHLVELDLGGPRLLSRIEGHGEFEAGQSCRLGIDLDAVHLFHPETGARL